MMPFPPRARHSTWGRNSGSNDGTLLKNKTKHHQPYGVDFCRHVWISSRKRVIFNWQGSVRITGVPFSGGGEEPVISSKHLGTGLIVTVELPHAVSVPETMKGPATQCIGGGSDVEADVIVSPE